MKKEEGVGGRSDERQLNPSCWALIKGFYKRETKSFQTCPSPFRLKLCPPLASSVDQTSVPGGQVPFRQRCRLWSSTEGGASSLQAGLTGCCPSGV